MKMQKLILVLLFLIGLSTATTGLPYAPADEKLNTEVGESMFSSLFGKLKNTDPQMLEQKFGQGVDQMNLARTIFKGTQFASKASKVVGGKNQKGMNPAELIQKLNQIPLDMILPNRRKPLNLDFQKASSEIKKHQKGKGKTNLALLNTFLEQFGASNIKDKLEWQNPAFKDHTNGQRLPMFKVFGKKNRGKVAHPNVQKQKIQELIQTKVPFLKDGKILSMMATNFRKGILLKIQYIINESQTSQEKLYTITARYKPKKHHLEIISLKENENWLERNNNNDIVVNDPEGEKKANDFIERAEKNNLDQAFQFNIANKEKSKKKEEVERKVQTPENQEEKVEKRQATNQMIEVPKKQAVVEEKIQALEKMKQKVQKKEVVKQKLQVPEEKKQVQENEQVLQKKKAGDEKGQRKEIIKEKVVVPQKNVQIPDKIVTKKVKTDDLQVSEKKDDRSQNLKNLQQENIKKTQKSRQQVPIQQKKEDNQPVLFSSSKPEIQIKQAEQKVLNIEDVKIVQNGGLKSKSIRDEPLEKFKEVEEKIGAMSKLKELADMGLTEFPNKEANFQTPKEGWNSDDKKPEVKTSEPSLTKQQSKS